METESEWDIVDIVIEDVLFTRPKYEMRSIPRAYKCRNGKQFNTMKEVYEARMFEEVLLLTAENARLRRELEQYEGDGK